MPASQEDMDRAVAALQGSLGRSGIAMPGLEAATPANALPPVQAAAAPPPPGGITLADPGSIRPMQPVTMTAKPGSPLARAAVASDPLAMQQAPNQRLAAFKQEDLAKAIAALGGGAAAAPADLQLTMPTQVGPSPVQYHPGGWQAGLGGIRPDTEIQMLAAPRKEAEAGEKLARIQGHTTDVIGDMMAQAADEAKAHQAHRAELQARRDAQIDEAIRQREELSAKQAEMNPDGSRFWKNPGSILMAIGAAIQPGNAGMDRLYAAVDRDLNLQKRAFDQQGEKVRQKDTLIAQYDKVFGDRDTRDKAAQADAYENAARRMTAFAEKSKSQELIGTAEVNSAKLMSHAAMLRGQLDQMDHFKPYTTGGVSQGAKVDSSLLVSMPDGKTYRAPDVPTADKLRTNLGFTTQIQSNLNKALAIRKNASSVDMLNPHSTVRKELASLKAETAQIVTVRRGQGAMSKGDQEVADQAIGAIDGFLSNNDQVLRSTVERAGKHMQLELQASRAEEMDPGYGRDTKGEVVPTAKYVGSVAKPNPSMPVGRPLK